MLGLHKLVITETNISVLSTTCIHSFIHSLVFILTVRAGRNQSACHVTGMALAHCILGKSLGVVCHCFLPPLDVPTFAARCLFVRNDARDPSSERWKSGREIARQFCLNSDFHINLGIFYMPQIYDTCIIYK